MHICNELNRVAASGQSWRKPWHIYINLVWFPMVCAYHSPSNHMTNLVSTILSICMQLQKKKLLLSCLIYLRCAFKVPSSALSFSLLFFQKPYLSYNPFFFFFKSSITLTLTEFQPDKALELVFSVLFFPFEKTLFKPLWLF